MNGKLMWMVSVVALIVLAGQADADLITNLQLADGTQSSPIANITYTNPDGTGQNSASVYADPVVSSGTRNPLYYCIDLWHDNTIGSSYAITAVTSISFGGSSTFSDADNRLAWLVSQAPQATPDERGAVQLAMWYTIDNKNNGFSVSSFSDSTMRDEYNALIAFTGYHSNVTYGAQLFQATHTGSGLSQNQDMIIGVPEPSSFVLASIGLVGLTAFCLMRARWGTPRQAVHC